MNGLSYFDKNTISQIIELSDNSLYANIKRWLKNGEIIQLKKGLYVTKEFHSRLPDKDAYAEFISNKLREPSYLSMEYVLQKYNILTEAVYAVTSVTLKGPRIYTNNLGTFVFRNIKENLFSGFEITSRGQFEIKEASKAKALFDYLYLKTQRIKIIDEEVLESFRLNLDTISNRDILEFTGYCQTAGAKKIRGLPKLLRKLKCSIKNLKK